MSSHASIQAPSDPGRLPMTLPLLAEKKRLGEPIVMVTAYDYPSARAAEAAGVDLVLVGDSAATTVLGYNATTPVELEDMLVLARAVRRGLRPPLLIGDLPFGSYEVSDEQAITTAMRMVKEAGCEVVKLEGGGGAPVRPPRADRGGGREDRLRGARPAGRGLLRAGVRGDSRRGHRGADAPYADTRHRHRGGRGNRRAGARVPRSAGHPRRARRALRQALRQPPAGDERRRHRLRRGRALTALPRPRAHLLDRRRRAIRAAHAPGLRRAPRRLPIQASGSP